MSSSGSDEEAAGFDDCDFYEDDGEIYPNLFRDLKSRMKSIKADVHKALKSLPPEPTQTHDEHMSLNAFFLAYDYYIAVSHLDEKFETLKRSLEEVEGELLSLYAQVNSISVEDLGKGSDESDDEFEDRKRDEHDADTSAQHEIDELESIESDLKELKSDLAYRLHLLPDQIADAKDFVLDLITQYLITPAAQGESNSKDSYFLCSKGMLFELVVRYWLQHHDGVSDVTWIGGKADRGIDFKFKLSGNPSIAQCKQGGQFQSKGSSIIREAVGAAVLVGVMTIWIFTTANGITKEVKKVIEKYKERGYTIKIFLQKELRDMLDSIDDEELHSLLKTIGMKSKPQ